MFKKIGDFFSNLFKPEPMYAPVPEKLEPKDEPLVKLGPEPTPGAPIVTAKVETPVVAPAAAPTAEVKPTAKKQAVKVKKPKVDRPAASDAKPKNPRTSKKAQ